MSDLKPCPFCGRIPVVDDCGDHRFFVRCECGINQDKLYSQKCDAIRSWNRRKNIEKCGRWITIHDDVFAGTYKCSVCGSKPPFDDDGFYFGLTNYCPNCGARMEQKE